MLKKILLCAFTVSFFFCWFLLVIPSNAKRSFHTPSELKEAEAVSKITRTLQADKEERVKKETRNRELEEARIAKELALRSINEQRQSDRDCISNWTTGASIPWEREARGKQLSNGSLKGTIWDGVLDFQTDEELFEGIEPNRFEARYEILDESGHDIESKLTILAYLKPNDEPVILLREVKFDSLRKRNLIAATSTNIGVVNAFGLNKSHPTLPEPMDFRMRVFENEILGVCDAEDGTFTRVRFKRVRADKKTLGHRIYETPPIIGLSTGVWRGQYSFPQFAQGSNRIVDSHKKTKLEATFSEDVSGIVTLKIHRRKLRKDQPNVFVGKRKDSMPNKLSLTATSAGWTDVPVNTKLRLEVKKVKQQKRYAYLETYLINGQIGKGTLDLSRTLVFGEREVSAMKSGYFDSLDADWTITIRTDGGSGASTRGPKRYASFKLGHVEFPAADQPMASKCREWLRRKLTDQLVTYMETIDRHDGKTEGILVSFYSNPHLTVNELAISTGHAWASLQDPLEKLKGIEAESMAKKIGIWSRAGSVRPSEWMKMSDNEKEASLNLRFE